MFARPSGALRTTPTGTSVESSRKGVGGWILKPKGMFLGSVALRPTERVNGIDLLRSAASLIADSADFPYARQDDLVHSRLEPHRSDQSECADVGSWQHLGYATRSRK